MIYVSLNKLLVFEHTEKKTTHKIASIVKLKCRDLLVKLVKIIISKIFITTSNSNGNINEKQLLTKILNLYYFFYVVYKINQYKIWTHFQIKKKLKSRLSIQWRAMKL